MRHLLLQPNKMVKLLFGLVLLCGCLKYPTQEVPYEKRVFIPPLEAELTMRLHLIHLWKVESNKEAGRSFRYGELVLHRSFERFQGITYYIEWERHELHALLSLKSRKRIREEAKKTFLKLQKMQQRRNEEKRRKRAALAADELLREP